MKLVYPILALLILTTACKQTASEEKQVESQEETVSKKEYPAAIAAVFDAHGGMEAWNKKNQLSFDIKEGDAKETHLTSLKDRKALITNPNWTIGADGKDVWLDQKEADSYSGNARFYHNLMFYFYAMPFVLADDGINYTDVPTTELAGKSYEGIKISYGADVGDSPKDEYILFYDPTTNQMEWLGYTVTYRSNEKSDKWSYIKYADWQNVSGVVLPKTLVWYKVEDGKPTEPARDGMEFSNVSISTDLADSAQFEQPESAEVIAR